jgi:hypothetical protein
MAEQLRGPFQKLVDSPNSKKGPSPHLLKFPTRSNKVTTHLMSELCEGAVTVSFSKYLPWQAMHFLQRSTHYSKTCCNQFEISCLGAPSSWLEKPRTRMGARSELKSVFGLERACRWDPIRTSDIQSRSLPLAISGRFQP